MYIITKALAPLAGQTLASIALFWPALLFNGMNITFFLLFFGIA